MRSLLLVVALLLTATAAAAATPPEAPRRRQCHHILAESPFPTSDFSVLSPHISEVTMRSHYQSHQVSGYIGKLNVWVKHGVDCPEPTEPSLLLRLVRDLSLTDPLFRSAAQGYNHALYFAMLRKNTTLVAVQASSSGETMFETLAGLAISDAEIDQADAAHAMGGEEAAAAEEGGSPSIVMVQGQRYFDNSAAYSLSSQLELSAEITKHFGSPAAFKKQFTATAVGHFGSGWVWLMRDIDSGVLSIEETHDGGVPNKGNVELITITENATTTRDEATVIAAEADTTTVRRVPMAVIDVWEHAYYIDYQAGRAAYVEGWFHAMDWSLVARRLNATDFEMPNPNQFHTAPTAPKPYTYPRFY